MTRFIPLFFVMAILPWPAFAKRAVPAKVEPVVYQGIRYTAPNDDGHRAYIEAWDTVTQKKLWVLTVFTNRFDPKMEEDIQAVYIQSLKLQGERLIVISETGKSYRVDLKTRAVTQSPDRTTRDLLWSEEIPERLSLPLYWVGESKIEALSKSFPAAQG